MTQRSRPQADNNATLAYIDSGPYSRDQWAERIRAAHTGDAATTGQRAQLRGVVPTYADMLVVTEPVAGTIRVGTGAGMTYGSYLFNDAVVNFSAIGDSPAANPRIDLVCMVENNTNGVVANGVAANGWIFPTVLADYNLAASVPAYTARLVIVKGAEAAGPVEPVLDISTTLFMVAIAKYQIAVGGVISAFVDRREFVDSEIIVGCNATENDEIHDALILGAEVNDGVGAAGLGAAIKFRLENAAGTFEDAAALGARWADATNGSEEGLLELRLPANGTANLCAVVRAPTANSADGNARGGGAVDLQTIRNANTQVASGDYSFVCGQYCTASGASSFASGASTVASGQFSSAMGSGSTASGEAAHATGAGSTASGSKAHAQGLSVTAAGDYSHALGRLASDGAFDGVFIWADSENAAFAADRANQFKVRASGGTYLRQNNNAAALTVLSLDQQDQDETFIDFVGTSAANQAQSISTINGTGTVDGPKNPAIAEPGWAFVGMVRIDVNGALFWMPYYEAT